MDQMFYEFKLLLLNLILAGIYQFEQRLKSKYKKKCGFPALNGDFVIQNVGLSCCHSIFEEAVKGSFIFRIT